MIKRHDDRVFDGRTEDGKPWPRIDRRRLRQESASERAALDKQCRIQVRKSAAGLRRFRFAIDSRSRASARFDCADR